MSEHRTTAATPQTITLLWLGTDGLPWHRFQSLTTYSIAWIATVLTSEKYVTW